MHSLSDLIALACDEGCGLPLTDLLKTPAYAEALQRYREALARPLGSPEGRARAAGHIEFGAWLNGTSEDIALGESSPLAGDYTGEFEPALQVLGDRLIESAAAVLPAEIKALAEAWTSSDAAGQFKLALELDRLLPIFAKDQSAIEDQAEADEEASDKDETSPAAERPITQQQLRTAIDNFERQRLVGAAPTVIVGEEADKLLSDPHELGASVPFYIVTADERGTVLELGLPAEPKRDKRYLWLDTLMDELGYRRSLPRNLATNQLDGKGLNCLGMGVLLCGFARLSGAKYLLSRHIEHYGQARWEFEGKCASRLLKATKEIGFVPQTIKIRELKHTIETAQTIPEQIADFHYSVVIQLADGSWLMLDPYQRNVAPLAETYGIDQAVDQLERYRDALPGLTLIRSDQGTNRRWLSETLGVVEAGITACGSVLQLLQESVYEPVNMERLVDRQGLPKFLPVHSYREDLDWLMYLLEGTEPGLWLMEQLYELDALGGNYNVSDWPVSLVLDVERARPRNVDPEEDLKLLMAGGIPAWMGNSFDIQHEAFLHHEPTRLAQQNGLAGLFIEIARDLWETRLNDFGTQFAHPVIEVMLPEYNLALAVVNQVRCWTDNAVSGSVFLEYSSSPMYWHDAVDLAGDRLPEDSPLLQRSEDAVRSTPFLHPACSNKLAYLDRLRSELETQNGSTKQEADGHRCDGGSDRLDPERGSRPQSRART